jgi:hypothetical protein
VAARSAVAVGLGGTSGVGGELGEQALPVAFADASGPGQAGPGRGLPGRQLRLVGRPDASASAHRRGLFRRRRLGCGVVAGRVRVCGFGPGLHGGGLALPMAVEYLRGEVAPLLQGRYTDTVGRALFSATAEFTLGVGWMAYDAGKHGLAQRYMAQALRMSHAANDRAFGGRILAAMSHQALHLGDVRHGTDFACAARAGTQGAITPTTVAMLAAMEACAHAARGDAALCLRALSDAERALPDRAQGKTLRGSISMRAGSQGTWHGPSATSTAPPRLSSSRSGQSSSAIPRTFGLASSVTPSLPAPTPNRATLMRHVRSVAKRLRR